jgi:type II secretory pathway component PulJ
VMQSDARPQVKQVPDKLWVNILNWVLYWVKTFTDGAKQTVNVEILAND